MPLSKNSKRSFTLFEILVAMALVATALGFLTFSVNRGIKQKKFEHGVEQVITKLSLAQELMLDFHTDVRCCFTHGDKEIVCLLEVAQPLPDRLAQSINRYREMKGIERIEINGAYEDSFSLAFDGSLGVRQEARLTLFGNGQREEIYLDDYPSAIRRGYYEKKNRTETSFPEKIFSSH